MAFACLVGLAALVRDAAGYSMDVVTRRGNIQASCVLRGELFNWPVLVVMVPVLVAGLLVSCGGCLALGYFLASPRLKACSAKGTQTDSVEEDYNRWTIEAIRSELRSHELSVSGNKADLVARVKKLKQQQKDS
jgi:hypothetical protein